MPTLKNVHTAILFMSSVRHLLCAACDLATHSTKVLYNRESRFEGFYRPLSPTTVTHQDDEGSLAFQEHGVLIVLVFQIKSDSTSCNNNFLVMLHNFQWISID
jgi:hypothetical protein